MNRLKSEIVLLKKILESIIRRSWRYRQDRGRPAKITVYVQPVRQAR